MGEIFDWNHQGLNWSHFHSLANLLSLRNGGQAESSSLSDTVLEEDWDHLDNEEDGRAPSLDTGIAHKISDSGHGRLKQKFLDCLAEFAANKKGGAAVACSAMKESEDNVIVWISRNEGFSDADKPTFDKLEKLLSSLSCNNDQSDTLLWEEMVMYQQNRIEHNYIPNLRASFKAYDAVCADNGSNTAGAHTSADTALSALRVLLFGSNSNDTSTLENHTRLIIASYHLRRTREVEKVLYKSLSATPKSKRLWMDICLFARLRVAFQNFKDTTLALPSFEQVRIILVPRAFAPANPSQRPLSLKQTFHFLHLDMTPAATKAVLGHNWTVAKVEREFAQRQKQKPRVHAEVQMLLFLNTNESSTSGVFPYLGCSKLSCFMCNSFVQSYGRFKTRGCHGRLFKPWTVPTTDSLLPGQAGRTARALISVQKEVERKLKESGGFNIPREKTSAIGGSSVLSGQQQEHPQRQLQIDRLRMKVERERVAEMFRRQTEDMAEPTSRTYLGQESDECSICSRSTSRRCSVCNKGFFCSDSCQEKRYGSHLFTCSKRPLTSADYLWKSLVEDLMPQEEEVLEDFGFNNTLSYQDQTYLLGVYQGLYLSGEYKAEDLHDWRIRGILAEKITEFCYGIPEHSRGQYLPWIVKNIHVLEGNTTKEEAQQRLVSTFYDKARPYLDAEDHTKEAKDLKPEAKEDSFNLLAEILHRMSPNPSESNWYSFGFVACRGHREETTLVDIYQLLLVESDGTFFYEFHNNRRDVTQPATLTEFWKAFESGTLIQLMDSKGLKRLRSDLPYLEGFLSVPPTGLRPSVWDLKQFLEINDPMDFPPIPSVRVDYGFINCRNFEETCTLMEIYGKVLETANPVELHLACVAGNIFQFASDYVHMEERWRPLMKNFYPLKVVESEVESEPEPESESRSEVGSEAESEVGTGAHEEATESPSLLSKFWRFIGGNS